MPIFISEGFPEFARFFNHSHLWKLQLSCVNLSMTIGTQENAFFDFFLNLLPTSCISFSRNTKVFLQGVKVVKFQSLNASFIATYLTAATFIADRHQSHLLSSSLNCFEKILSAFLICALFCHCKRSCSAYSRMLCH